MFNAETVIQQLGGNRFCAMTGAKGFTKDAEARALSFKLPSNFAHGGINAVRITLEPSDTYKVVFYRIRGTKVTPVSVREDVYGDKLQSIFSEVTGLDTRL